MSLIYCYRTTLVFPRQTQSSFVSTLLPEKLGGEQKARGPARTNKPQSQPLTPLEDFGVVCAGGDVGIFPNGARAILWALTGSDGDDADRRERVERIKTGGYEKLPVFSYHHHTTSKQRHDATWVPPTFYILDDTYMSVTTVLLPSGGNGVPSGLTTSKKTATPGRIDRLSVTPSRWQPEPWRMTGTTIGLVSRGHVLERLGAHRSMAICRF